jgi:RHS repeat-associated protein
MVSSRATQRQRAVPFCRKRPSRPSLAAVGGFSAIAKESRCSGGQRISEVRRYPREVCVARYYDPSTGQFLSIDPAVADTDAPFNYVGDDPLNGVDPSGLSGGGLFGISITVDGYCARWITCPGSTPKAHIDQVIANGAAGVLNAVTGGNGQTVAGWLGIQCNADWSSSATAIGNDIGTVAALGLPESDTAELVTDAATDFARGADADLPGSTVIVHGGQSELPPPGELFSGSQGESLSEAAQGVPHGTIRSTTAGEIRTSGGTVEANPEFNENVGRTNYQHVDVCLGDGPCPFGEPRPNPVPRSGRFGGPGYPYEDWEP